MKKQQYCWDIETFPNYFLVVYKNYKTKEFTRFEISEWQNDIDKLVAFVKNDYYVGFNSLHFDGPVLNYILKEYKSLKMKDGFNIAFKIWEFAQLIINDTDRIIGGDEEDKRQLELFEREEEITPFDTKKYIGNNFDKYKSYRWGMPWTTIDLFMYWSKLIRQARKISLKGLACHMNWEWIQELPLSPTSFITADLRQDVIDYCDNDVNVTEKLLDTLKDDVNFRITLIPEFGDRVLSWDGPKIGMEALAKSIADKSGLPLEEIKGHKTIRKSLTLSSIVIDVDFKDSSYE
jgi:hypothetical protein